MVARLGLEKGPVELRELAIAEMVPQEAEPFAGARLDERRDDAPVHRLGGLGRPDVFPEPPPVAALRLSPERDAARGDDLEHLTEVVELLAHDLDEAGHDVDVLDVGEDHVEGRACGLLFTVRMVDQDLVEPFFTRRTHAIPVSDLRPSMRDSATEFRSPEGRPGTA